MTVCRFEDIKQIISNPSGTDNHQAFDNIVFNKVMNVNHIHAIAGYKDFIARLNNVITVRNNQLMVALNGTDNNVAEFFTELIEGHLTEVVAFQNFKFHQHNAAIDKMFHR